MKKCVISILIITALFISMAMPALATSSHGKSAIENKVYLDNGEYYIVSIESIDTAKASTKSGTKTYKYYSSSDELLWKVVLSGTYSYSYGVSSTCTNASHTISIYADNWSVGSASSYKSEDTAYTAVKMNRQSLGIVVGHIDVNMSLKCDKYGVLS